MNKSRLPTGNRGKESLSITDVPVRRASMASSLGCHVPGCAIITPDTQYPPNVSAAIQHRILCQTNTLSPDRFRFLRSQSRLYGLTLRTVDPLDPKLNLFTWLMDRPYPLRRRMQLWENAQAHMPGLVETTPYAAVLEYAVSSKINFGTCKTFLKKEDYPSFKNPRSINSREDFYKTVVGPVVEAISGIVYDEPWVVKHIPVADRPAYLDSYLGGFEEYYGTDYSSFESSITPSHYEATEHQVYSVMLRRCPWRNLALRLLRCTVGVSTLKTRYGVAKAACRMSGDMTTSLGNGLCNYLVVRCIAKELGWTEFRMVAEGDDGLIPRCGAPMTKEHFAAYGLTVTMTISRTVGAAGFCQMYWCDSENVVDPAGKLLTIGWSFAQQRRGGPVLKRSLLRAKALSLAYELPGCPVLSSLAKFLLRCTNGPALFSEDVWWRREVMQDRYADSELSPSIKERLHSTVPMERRFLVEKLFNVTIEQQFELEQWFDSLQHIQPLNHPIIISLVEQKFPHSVKMWRLYAVE